MFRGMKMRANTWAQSYKTFRDGEEAVGEKVPKSVTYYLDEPECLKLIL